MAVRKQSGCVVFRYDRKFDYEILLVKSSDGKDWVFPKGGVEPDLTPQQSAIKETYEEAGVAGRLMSTLGKYEYKKQGKPQKVTMYSMLYTRDTEDWPEKHLRKRKWFSYKDAMKKLPKLLRPLLEKLKEDRLLGLAANSNMDNIAQFIRELPVVVDSKAEVDVADGDTVNVIVKQGDDRTLRLRIEDWGQHPTAEKVTIHWDYMSGTHEAQHFKNTTLDHVVGSVSRIIGRFISNTLAEGPQTKE